LGHLRVRLLLHLLVRVQLQELFLLLEPFISSWVEKEGEWGREVSLFRIEMQFGGFVSGQR
jgi:hypothetical protein